MKPTTVEQYLKGVDDAQRMELERIRRIIKEMVSGASEGISYGMPVFKYKGKYLIGFAAFKEHMSLFPGSLPIEILREALRDYKISKGTIQFNLDHPLPDSLLIEIIQINQKSMD